MIRFILSCKAIMRSCVFISPKKETLFRLKSIPHIKTICWELNLWIQEYQKSGVILLFSHLLLNNYHWKWPLPEKKITKTKKKTPLRPGSHFCGHFPTSCKGNTGLKSRTAEHPVTLCRAIKPHCPLLYPTLPYPPYTAAAWLAIQPL